MIPSCCLQGIMASDRGGSLIWHGYGMAEVPSHLSFALRMDTEDSDCRLSQR